MTKWDHKNFDSKIFSTVLTCMSSTQFILCSYFFLVYYSVTPDSGPSQLSIVLDTTVTEPFTREWHMKIYQYECSSPNLAPSGCLQYYTAASGQFSSFNYQTEITQGMIS